MSRWDARDLRHICCVGGRTAMVWYDDQTRDWWMEDRDPSVARARLLRTLSAINVTNAYEVLDVSFLEKLAREAHWLEIGARGLAQSDEREAARPVAPPEFGMVDLGAPLRFDDTLPPRYDAIHVAKVPEAKPGNTSRQGLKFHPSHIESREVGISIRFIREFDIVAHDEAERKARLTGDEHVPCGTCVRMIGGGCRNRGCLRQQYYAFAVAGLPGYDWYADADVVSDHDLARLADDGGPADEGEL